MTPEQKQERDAVLAWLRDLVADIDAATGALTGMDHIALRAARKALVDSIDAIERGDHREVNNG